jgi:hypothetical protein
VSLSVVAFGSVGAISLVMLAVSPSCRATADQYKSATYRFQRTFWMSSKTQL